MAKGGKAIEQFAAYVRSDNLNTTLGPLVNGKAADFVREQTQEAIILMNDSDFGLTACIFTQDKGIHLGEQLETGTFFINRCDYLDPALAWAGIKQSGREIELKMTRVGSYIALRQANFDGVLEWILQLRKDLGIPHTLSAIGIDTLQRELVGKMSVSDAAASSNPIKFNEEQYSIIFVNAVKGTL